MTAPTVRPSLNIDCEAPTLLDAITSTITQAESVADIHVGGVEGEELVHKPTSPNAPAAAVNHWTERDANSFGFPSPAYGTSIRSQLWHWDDNERKLVNTLPATS